MRDKLIHEYFGVDLEIVWAVVKTDLPPVKPLIEHILRDIDKQDGYVSCKDNRNSEGD
jgi:uncharacterized protein with HEPN domain